MVMVHKDSVYVELTSTATSFESSEYSKFTSTGSLFPARDCIAHVYRLIAEELTSGGLSTFCLYLTLTVRVCINSKEPTEYGHSIPADRNEASKAQETVRQEIRWPRHRNHCFTYITTQKTHILPLCETHAWVSLPWLTGNFSSLTQYGPPVSTCFSGIQAGAHKLSHLRECDWRPRKIFKACHGEKEDTSSLLEGKDGCRKYKQIRWLQCLAFCFHDIIMHLSSLFLLIFFSLSLFLKFQRGKAKPLNEDHSCTIHIQINDNYFSSLHQNGGIHGHIRRCNGC